MLVDDGGSTFSGRWGGAGRVMTSAGDGRVDDGGSTFSGRWVVARGG
jgi:hypothetical protein